MPQTMQSMIEQYICEIKKMYTVLIWKGGRYYYVGGSKRNCTGKYSCYRR